MQISQSFDRETMKKIGKGAMIAGGGALLVYLLQSVGSMDFGTLTPVAVAVSSMLINVVKEYMSGMPQGE